MEKSRIGIEAGEDAGLFDQAVQDPVAVVEGGVEGVLRRSARPSVKAVFFGEQGGDALKVSPPCGSFESHEAASGCLQVRVSGREIGGALFDGPYRRGEVIFPAGARVHQFLQEADLVVQFLAHHGGNEFEPQRGVHRFELPAPDQCGAPHFGEPDTPHWIAVFVHEDDIDIVFEGEYHSLGGDHGLIGDDKALHLQRGDVEDPLLLLDTEALVLLCDKGSRRIDDDLHLSHLSLRNTAELRCPSCKYIKPLISRFGVCLLCFCNKEPSFNRSIHWSISPVSALYTSVVYGMSLVYISNMIFNCKLYFPFIGDGF